MSAQLPPLPKKDIYRAIDGELDMAEYARRLRKSKEGAEEALQTIDDLKTILGIRTERVWDAQTTDGEVNPVTETVKDVFEELLHRWREEQERAVLESPADKGVKAIRLDRIQCECDEYRRRFEAALGGKEMSA